MAELKTSDSDMIKVYNRTAKVTKELPSWLCVVWQDNQTIGYVPKSDVSEEYL